MIKQVKQLKEKNSLLEQTAEDLKMQLEALVMDAEGLKEEREEIEKLLFEDEDEPQAKNNSQGMFF